MTHRTGHGSKAMSRPYREHVRGRILYAPLMDVITGEDGLDRCWWGGSGDAYRRYHDTEWGFGVTEDRRLYEKLSLEAFQSGLSWLTILNKRENFRRAFSDFDPLVVAGYGAADVERLMSDSGIVRNERKVKATIHNAAVVLAVQSQAGSLAAYFWEHAQLGDDPPDAIPAHTDQSAALARDLKAHGFQFVGPTTVYAFMQAMGLVNDHLAGCHVRDVAQRSRLQAALSVGARDRLPVSTPRV